MFDHTAKIGILGGGQLGKMLCLAAADWDLKTYVLDAASHYPAAAVCAGFQEGDFRRREDVLAFGADKDLITIEIEHVDTEALHLLEKAGKKIHPSPRALDIIKDKGLQKTFYIENDVPTAPFRLFEDEHALLAALEQGEIQLPFVQKTRTAGYDGKGVAVIRSSADLETKLLSGPCLTEEWVDLQTEIAVVAARNEQDEVAVYPAVEMDFHPEANLVEFLLCPARISPLIEASAQALAERVIRAFDVCGLLAVEMFLTKDGRLLVNEVAPRPHNSGHHTINSAVTSQFQQHWRAVCGLPLGSTQATHPAAVMLNILGEPGHKGPVYYEGLEACLAVEGVYVHLYGKTDTAPFRKMGHITITGPNTEITLQKAAFIKETLKAKARV